MNEALIGQAIEYTVQLFEAMSDFNWYDQMEDQAFENARRALEEVIGSSEDRSAKNAQLLRSYIFAQASERFTKKLALA